MRFRQRCVKGRQTSARHLHDLETTRRYATLVAMVLEAKATLNMTSY